MRYLDPFEVSYGNVTNQWRNVRLLQILGSTKIVQRTIDQHVGYVNTETQENLASL